MTTATLRPNATIANDGAITSAASAHAATSDDSDSSYVTLDPLESLHVSLGTVTIGTGAVTKTFTLRTRCQSVGGLGYASFNTMIKTSLVQGAGIDLNATTTLGEHSGVIARSWTQTQVNDLGLQVSVYNTGELIDVMELYGDLVYVTIPVVAVDAVSPDPYTASTVVPITWVNTLDADGGAQTRFEVKVFTDAQYGAGGFDPDTTTPYYTTGEMVKPSASATVGPLENSDTYRAYVRVAQTVNGASHWSAWAYDEFTVNVTTSDVDTVTAVATNASGLITVTAAWDAASTGWEYIEVQRSIDAGATWADVRGATYVATVDTGATDHTVIDYETPNGTSTLYRARATYLSSSLPISGAWVQSSAATWSSDDIWIKAPDDPTLNTTFRPLLLTASRTRRAGVHRVLGRVNPVVVTDVRSGFSGSLPVHTLTTAEHLALRTILDGSSVLLIQHPASVDVADAYVVVLNDDTVRMTLAQNVARTWLLQVVEVDAPADPDAGR